MRHKIHVIQYSCHLLDVKKYGASSSSSPMGSQNIVAILNTLRFVKSTQYPVLIIFSKLKINSSHTVTHAILSSTLRMFDVVFGVTLLCILQQFDAFLQR